MSKIEMNPLKRINNYQKRCKNMKHIKTILILIALVAFLSPAHAARTFLKPFLATSDSGVFTFQLDANPDGDTFISGVVTTSQLTIGTDTYPVEGYFVAKIGRHGGVIWVKSISDLTRSTFFIDSTQPKKCELVAGTSNVVIALHNKLLLIDFDGNVLDQKNLNGAVSSGGLTIHKDNGKIAVASQIEDKQLMVATYSILSGKFQDIWQKDLTLQGSGHFSGNGLAIDDIGDVFISTQIDDLNVNNADDVWIEVDGRSGYSSKDAFIVKDSSTQQIKDLKGMFNGKGDSSTQGILKSPELLYNEPLDLKQAVPLVNMRIKGISLSYMTYTMEFWSKGLVIIYYGRKNGGGDMEFEIGEESPQMVEFEQEYDSDDDFGQVTYELPNAMGLHHWAAAFDGRYIKMYCDGVLINQLEADPIEVDTDEREFLINGTFDEFRLWTAERKASDIRAFYQKRVKGDEDDLLVCYRPLHNKTRPQTVLIRLDHENGHVSRSRALTWDDGETSGICHSGGMVYLSQQSNSDALLRSYNIMLEPKKNMIISGDSTSDATMDFKPGIISMKSDIEGNLLVLGSTAKGTTSFYDASSPPDRINASPFVERNSSNKGFFIGKWDASLDCDWVQFSNASTSAGIVSDYGYGDLVQDPKDSDWIFFNGSFSDGSLSFGGMGESNTLINSGKTDAFMCGIRPDGNFLKEVSLEIVSEPDALISVAHDVLPKEGKATYLEGTSFEASVPEMIQQNALIEGQMYTDVIRYVCTGFNVEGTITGGTENRYVFTLNDDTRLIFNWQKKIAVIVDSQFENTSNLSEAFGNPEPAVGRHYYNNKDRVILQIDGMVKSYEKPGTRHVVSKYSQNDQLFNIDETVEDRFQVTQFTVTEPTLVRFYWMKQYRIQVSTSGSSSSQLPAICQIDSFGNCLRQSNGIGEFWFDSESHVHVMAKEYQNLMALSGWFNGSGPITTEGELSDLKTRSFNNAPFRYMDIQSLTSEMTLTWNYGDRIFREIVQIGNPLRFFTVPADIRNQRQKDNAPANTTLVESPPDSTPSNMYLWSEFEHRLYPLRDINPTHTGIQKIERKGVKELAELSVLARNIQQEMDNADAGINPLGVAHETVPFDVDYIAMTTTEPGYETHFEQMYDRAKSALKNALRIFNYMNDIENQIRQVGSEVDDLRNEAADDDLDFRSRAIEIFGTPYEGTIGSGKTYPAGYMGPDIYYYNYIDVNEISNLTIPKPNSSLTVLFEPGNVVYTKDNSQKIAFNDIDVAYTHFLPQDFPNGYNASWDSAEFRHGIIDIKYPITAGDYSFVAPEDWGMRQSPGEIQQCLINMLQEQAELEIAIAEYAENVQEVKNIIMEIKGRTELFSQQVHIQNALNAYIEKVNNKIIELDQQVAIFEGIIEYIEDIKDALIEGLPTVVGFSNDPSSAARAALDLGILATKIYSTHQINDLNVEIKENESDKELIMISSDIQMQMAEFRNDIQGLLIDLNRALITEPAARLNIFRQREALREQSNIFKSTIMDGMHLLEERGVYNTSFAESIQTRSYYDMLMRLNQNEAVSEYRAAFDMAARYIYLAAKIYDYETNLSHDHPLSAIPLLSKIVKERTLGIFEDSKPIIGMGGLGEILVKLNNNYQALKTQMGIANPQNETGRFSLRKELFRIKEGLDNDKKWRDTLERYRVDNLWTVPEYKRFCRSTAPESAGPQPGIAIPFQTAIMYGQNFFGWPLGSGDNAYDASHYATRIKSVGLWFENYDNSQLSETPRAYLVPAGMDIMYVPDSTHLDTREWHIVDQRIPIPMPISDTDLKNPLWITNVHSVDIPGYPIRKFSSLRVYHDSGYFDENEMTFDSRLLGRSVWNSRWMLIIPGITFLADPDDGLETFIHGEKIPGSEERDQNGVKDIKMFFETYAISGS
jgi:hypothetical protein